MIVLANDGRIQVAVGVDLRSSEEAREYLMKLRTILQYLGVSSGNMEEGSFRCDANISLLPGGGKEYTPKEIGRASCRERV